MFTNPSIQPEYLLKITGKLNNGTPGEKGLVPSRFVFGTVFQICSLSTDLSARKERMGIIKTSQAEVNIISAQR